jgi:predicted RNA-binding Zn ribbon-like protein
VTDAALIVALANARSPRRPTGARARRQHDTLSDARTATGLLAPFLGRPVGPRELPALRELQRAVLALVDTLIDGRPAQTESLNRLAGRHTAVRALERRADGTLHATLRYPRPSAAAILTDRAIGELAELDPRRLRRCGRPECALVFYDRTRSGTQRWHSERPCGLRERQRRHRALAG